MTVVINGTTGITTPAVVSSGTAQAPTVQFSTWTITESGGKLYFAVSGVNKGSLDSSGNLIVTGNVTAYGTP